MKGIHFPKLMLVLVCLFAYAFSANAQIKSQTFTKEDKKFWKKKAKGYVKRPAELKQELENYTKQINDLKNQVATLTAEFDATSGTNSGLQALIDSLKWDNVQLKSEKQKTESKLTKMEVALKGEKKANESGVKRGLVYRTQIGAFVNHQMQNTPAGADDFLYEKADGFNKYLVGNFRTQAESEAFALELKKLGIKDAWAVPYIDGIRVTFQEANAYLAKQGAPQAAPATDPVPPAPKSK